MSQSELQRQIEAARAYENLMVPALLGVWAPKVADAAQLWAGHRVLDVACGTGILAREVLSRTGSSGAVTGLDPSPGMLTVARELEPAVEWREGLAESLPFPDESFDTVVSQFGMMFFSDCKAALRETWRVLVPGGRMAVAVWDSLDSIPAYAAEVALIERVAGTSAADPLRAPFALGDPLELLSLFRDAGFASAELQTSRAPARFPGIRIMLEADLRGWLPMMGVVLPEEQIASILEQGEEVLGSFVDTDGSAVFETSAHIVSGVK